MILKPISRKIEKKVFAAASLLVTVSDHFKDLIIRQHQISSQKIIVLPNAIDPKRFKISPTKRIQKKDLGIESKYVIGCTGAFVPWHGLEFLIHALNTVIISYDIHVLLIGDGPVRKTVEALARQYYIAERVTFTRMIDPNDVPYYLDILDVCVIPDQMNTVLP